MENISIEPELQSLLAKLEANIERRSNQIETLRRDNAVEETLLQNVKRSLATLHPENKSAGRASKAETVRNAIASLKINKFTQVQVEAAIRQMNPSLPINSARIRTALWTLANRSEFIRVATKGNNNAPAVYEKLNAKQGENGSNGNPAVKVGVPDNFKRVEAAESGRRPYGTSSEAILAVLRGATDKMLKPQEIVALSGTSYGTTTRILRDLEDEKKAKREDGKWALIL